MKVDILVPPTLGLPEIRFADVVDIDFIPVMPLFDLIIMKTQGWWDHRNSDRAGFRAKESADVADIYALLDCADAEKLSYYDEIDQSRHEEEFIDNALYLVQRFARTYRTYRRWKRLGFPL